MLRIPLLSSILLAALAPLAAPPALAAEPSGDGTNIVDFAPALETGDTARYAFTTSVRQTASSPMRPPSTLQAISIEATLRIEAAEIKNDVASLGLTYERLAATFESPTAKLQFDSGWSPDKDGDNLWAAPVRAIIGRPMRIEVGPGGEMLSFEPPETGLTDPTEVQLAAQLINEETLRQLCQALYGLKSSPSTAQPGDEWSIEDTTPSEAGTMTLTRRFTLDRVEDGRAFVRIAGDVRSSTSDEAIKQNPALRSIEWHEGTVGGSAIWSVEESLLERYEATISAAATNRAPEQGQNPLTLTIESHSTLSLLP